MWLKVLVIAVLLVAASLAGTQVYGSFRWKADTQELRSHLETARVPIQPQMVHFRELDELPAPVQRYFRKVLKDGQPMISGVWVQHTGSFNMGQTIDQWQPFTSEQRVITQRPGFDWNAQVAMMPGVSVRVHDAYIAGEGILHAALLGVVPLVDLRGVGDVAEGELMRFFAEAAWYPTALLPSQNVVWEAVDARSALSTLTEGAISLTMRFTFNEQDLIESVRAEARGRTVGGNVIPTPWHGRFWNYQQQQGMWIPIDGEVAWLLPEGAKPYWRGSITEIVYEFAHETRR